eukprot:7389073-Prymnesium_polylepis.1
MAGVTHRVRAAVLRIDGTRRQIMSAHPTRSYHRVGAASGTDRRRDGDHPAVAPGTRKQQTYARLHIRHPHTTRGEFSSRTLAPHGSSTRQAETIPHTRAFLKWDSLTTGTPRAATHPMLQLYTMLTPAAAHSCPPVPAVRRGSDHATLSAVRTRRRGRGGAGGRTCAHMPLASAMCIASASHCI